MLIFLPALSGSRGSSARWSGNVGDLVAIRVSFKGIARSQQLRLSPTGNRCESAKRRPLFSSPIHRYKDFRELFRLIFSQIGEDRCIGWRGGLVTQRFN